MTTARRHTKQATTCAVLLLAAAGLASSPAAASAEDNPHAPAPATVGDTLWTWGNAALHASNEVTFANFAEAGPIQAARLLGTPNIILAGHGLPADDAEAERMTREAAGAHRLIWEITADGVTDGVAGGFVYEKRMALIRALVDRYPRIEGVLLDDMSSVGIDKGFKPEHIRRVRELLPDPYRSVKVWGVVYTMNLDRPNMNEYIRELDVINLWIWHAKDAGKQEECVARLAGLFPQKPIVLGVYLYDYGDGRRMPLDLLKQQCESALRLVKAGQIQGIVFLTITNDAETVGWAADWVRKVGAQKLPPRG